MRRRAIDRTALTFLLGISILGVVGIARQTPPRGTSAASEATGTGRISGVVLDAQGKPVTSAIVRLTGAAIPMGRAAITTDQGVFAFDRLPEGRFTLTSAKPAYLSVTYGSRKVGGAGTLIALAAGAQVADLRLTMPRGGAIGGTVRDSAGAPMPGLTVTLAMAVPRYEASPVVQQVLTDASGAYRLFGLAAGTYLVVVTETGSSGIGEIGKMKAAEVDATFAKLPQRPLAGSTPRPTPPEPSPASVVRPSETFATAPIFFPGVASLSAATPITLGIGEVREGADVVFQLWRSSRISGTLTGAGAQEVSLTLTPTISSSLMAGSGRLQPRPRGDGDFVFTSVTPGTYTLTARTSVGLPPGMRGAAPPPSGPHLVASTMVEVTGGDVSGVSLALGPSVSLSGRVVYEGTPAAAPNATSPFMIRMAPVRQVGIGMQPPAILSGSVQADGTFRVSGLEPGTYRLATLREPPGWRSKTAMHGGRDLLDSTIEIGADSITDVELTMTSVRSQIAGRVTDSAGKANADLAVVVFSADRAYWTPQSRRVLSARPDSDGTFEIDDIPAGDYFLAAINDADSDEWQKPAFLEQLAARAVKVTLAPGEKKRQDLQIARALLQINHAHFH